MKISIDQRPDGQLAVDSPGVPIVQVERILLVALAGVQRELVALRVKEVLDQRVVPVKLSVQGGH